MLIRDALGQSIPLRVLGNVCSRANEAGVRYGVTLSAAHDALLTLVLRDVNGGIKYNDQRSGFTLGVQECDGPIDLALWSENKRV